MVEATRLGPENNKNALVQYAGMNDQWNQRKKGERRCDVRCESKTNRSPRIYHEMGLQAQAYGSENSNALKTQARKSCMNLRYHKCMHSEIETELGATTCAEKARENERVLGLHVPD